jgi:hypothetical protein
MFETVMLESLIVVDPCNVRAPCNFGAVIIFECFLVFESVGEISTRGSEFDRVQDISVTDVIKVKVR